MHKVDLPADSKETEKILRRRRLEDERRKRVLDPQTSVVDKEALDKQILEKNARKQEEKILDEAYKKESDRQQFLLEKFEKDWQKQKVEVDIAIEEFRKRCQRAEHRREYYLNNKQQTFNVADGDGVESGPASMLRFAGEDPCRKDRIQKQNKLRQGWWDAQVRMKKEIEDVEKDNQRLRDLEMERIRVRMVELLQAEDEAKVAADVAVREYNHALAREREEKRKRDAEREVEADIRHYWNMQNSELLTETTDSTSVCGPHKVATDRFKGFSSEVLKMIRDEQDRQKMDKIARKQKERDQEEHWEDLRQRQTLLTELHDHERLITLKQQCQYDADTNKQLAQDKKIRDKILREDAIRDNITDDFFAQFQTSSR